MDRPVSPVVLDASALLLWMRGQSGARLVFPRLRGAAVSAAHWSQVWSTLDRSGVDADRTLSRVRPLGVHVEPVTVDDAVEAARLARRAPPDLALGDRCCLALGIRLARTVLTAERAWRDLDLPVDVQSVR